MSPFDDLPLVLTISEAAKLLRVGRNSAYEAARRGELPTLRIGRRLLVPRAALTDMLKVGYSQVQEARPSVHIVEEVRSGDG